MDLTRIELYASKLSDTSLGMTLTFISYILDMSVKAAIVTELRENTLDLIQGPDYSKYLSLIMPSYWNILSSTTPDFISNSNVFKLRLNVLEILHRLPLTEPLKDFAIPLMKVLMDVLRNDNEDCATISLKIIVDIHKNYKGYVEEFVQPFFDFVQDSYRNMKDAVDKTFSENLDRVATPTSGVEVIRNIPPSMDSFKVLTECPIIIALLFQLHKKYAGNNVPELVPLIIDVLNLQPTLQAQAHQEAAADGRIFTGMSPFIKNKVAYSEFKALQVKTLSFIAYILRSFMNTIRPYQQAIADAVVCLMKDCPVEESVTRKELLVATRHIWFTDFRIAFLKHVDVFLDENVLTGTGLTSRETLRPIAYSVLLDLLHHLRDDLSQVQILKIISICSRNLHDSTFNMSMQMICLKLLINFIDRITHFPSKQDARNTLVKILDAFSKRLAALKMMMPLVANHVKNDVQVPSMIKSVEEDPSSYQLKSFMDFGYVQPIRITTRFLEGSVDVMKDVKLLFKSLCQGIKTVTMALKSLVPLNVQGSEDIQNAFGLQDQIEQYTEIFRNGLDCFDLFNPESLMRHASDKDEPTALSKGIAAVTLKEEKETFDIFSVIFTLLEPNPFLEIFETQMQYLFDRMVANSLVTVIPQYFLGNQNISPSCNAILLRYLMNRLESLGSSDQNLTNVMMRCFKLIFVAVTVFPEKNESVFRLFIGNLIVSSMKLSAKAKVPVNYFYLLRNLFRSISGGRYELLYQEVLPLLPLIFDGLNSLMTSTHKNTMQELFVELCLTVPVRLSVLLPYLVYLMRPLVYALQSSSTELVGQGLRTMELCVDNLTQEFLEPIMAPYIDDLMDGLCRHLRPLPYNSLHSHTAMRILGKLGGRNRRALENVKNLKLGINTPFEQDVLISFKIPSLDNIHSLSVLNMIHLANVVLENPNENEFHHKQAFDFSKICLYILLDLTPEELNKLNASVVKINKKERKSLRGKSDNQMETDESEESPFIDPPSISFSKMEFLHKMICKLCLSYFSAACIPSLQADAQELLKKLCQLFTFVSVNEQVHHDDSKETNQSERGFLMALCLALSSENETKSSLAQEYIYQLFNFYKETAQHQINFEKYPLFHTLASLFSSHCYEQEPLLKNGGCLGISFLSSKIDLGLPWMLEHEMEFVKALLFVLKDVSPSISSLNLEEAISTFSHVLKVCNRQEDDVGNAERETKFNSLVSLLIGELPNSNSVVRETIQSAFQLLADLSGNEVTEILIPVRDGFLTPIFVKPLRALPAPIQMGHIDAITYCLSLRPPLLTFSEELLRLIQEALALADAEDSALSIKSNQSKNSSLVVNFRVLCIKLLSAVMANPEVMSPRQQTTRSRIISIFFKSLYSKSTEIVDCAYKALQQVLQQHKLPKDLLQTGLRPILVNLSEAKRLTVSGLEGLGRLLELLNSYFKVEIGKKLLDHLRVLAEPSLLEESSNKALSEIEEIKIIVAILETFSLLPATANIFMDDILRELITLEYKLKRFGSSPFRKPVVKYLNRYASHAVDYFYDKILDSSFSRLFVSILSCDQASVLRLEVMKSPEKFLGHTLNCSKRPPDEIPIRKKQGILILRVLMEYHPEWIDKSIIPAVQDIWKGCVIGDYGIPTTMSEQIGESNHVLEILMIVCRQYPQDIDILYELLYAFEKQDILDHSRLKHFLYEHLANQMTIQDRVAALEKFLIVFSSEMTQESKRIILHYLVIPLSLLTAEKNPEQVTLLYTPNVIELIQNKIWTPLSMDNADEFVSDDALKVEILQLTAFLIQFASDAISENRKNIIKFAWKHFKVEDTICKQAAYVVLARFIREYETPEKIVIQIYIALLRAFLSEGKVLVKQALDILVPTLPSRYPAEAGSDLATWFRWTRKIIIEEGHSIPQMVMIYQLIIRHSDLFYETREHSIPLIVYSLVKLGLSPNASPETRTLTLDIGEVLLSWETRAIEEYKSRNMDSNNVDSNNVDSMDWTGDVQDGTLQEKLNAISTTSCWNESNPTSFQEMILNYLICFSLSINENLLIKGLAFRSYELIKSFLKIWPETVIKLSQFDKALASNEGNPNLVLFSNAIDIMTSIVSFKSPSWTLANLPVIQKYLDSWIKTGSSKLAENLQSLVRALFIHVQYAPESVEISSFKKLIDSSIQNGLRESSNNNNTLLQVTIALINASHEYRDYDATIIVDLCKTLQRVLRDVLPCAPASSNVSNNNTTNTSTTSTGSAAKASETCLSIIQILDKKIQILGDQRRSFLQCCSTLIETCDEPSTLSCMISICKRWVFSETDAFPTIKEKANLLNVFISLENRKIEGAMDEFLELTADIYENPAFIGSELTVKLEPAFLLGTIRVKNPLLKSRFLSILDKSIGKTIYARLMYIMGVQNWEPIADSYWIPVALDLCLTAFESEATFMLPESCRLSLVCHSLEVKKTAVVVDKEFMSFMSNLGFDSKLSELFKPLRQLIWLDPQVAHSLWIQLFPIFWSCLNGRQRHDLTKVIIPLLARDYHVKQSELRPNVIQTLVSSICDCSPSIHIPPQLLKYLGKNFNAWFPCMEMLMRPVLPSKSNPLDESSIHESFAEALVELYSLIGEQDMVFGLERLGSLYTETNAGLSFEQIGMWNTAQSFYEAAQSKAKSGVLPFSDSEYSIWENNWISCTQRLQQWDILSDFSKSENDVNLILECAWRTSDWQTEKPLFTSYVQAMQENEARKQVFESFLLLQNYNEGKCAITEVQRACDEGVQYLMKQWLGLPDYVSEAHIPLLHGFQQFVEISEGCNVVTNLQTSNTSNIEIKTQELKGVLQVWRDRLPNMWDDIGIWSDLVSWRQHVFSIINKSYHPLIPQINQQAGANGGSPNSYAYRGYHETAWTINRFAHVCRKHQMTDVCISALSKIYTLPNIEIQEAFFKLREQAKCHFQSPSEYASGLDVIHNTNLLYFATPQKAEFFAMKGIFMGKLNLYEEAVSAFSSAIQIDLTLPKAWGAWGQYSDRLFTENPNDIKHAANALNCFLQAIGLYNNSRSRKFIAKVLWLLHLDDSQNTLIKVYDSYKGEPALWYWITFIPQLISCLSNMKESKFARQILMRMTKSFPQALQFQLRTAREELLVLKKQMIHRNNNTMNTEDSMNNSSSSSNTPLEAKDPLTTEEINSNLLDSKKHPWEHVEEIIAILKTNSPLLHISCELMADEISDRLKATADEDIYRLIVALLNDGVQMYMAQLSRDPSNIGQISSATQVNLSRFAESMTSNHSKYKAAFERDFISSKPNLVTLIARFRAWRDSLEIILDNQPQQKHLVHMSHYLSEFEYAKNEEIEVPGQYFLLHNNNKDFVRIERFNPMVDIVRGHTCCSRRITIRGHDGKNFNFIVQHPAARHCRREERILQFFRIFNSILDRKRETRRRNLQFHLPLVIPIGPSLRLVQDDISYKTLQDVFEEHCRVNGMSRDDPASFYTERLKTFMIHPDFAQRSKLDLMNLKVELYTEIASKYVPESILSNYCARKMSCYQDLWYLRKLFTRQMACNTFITHTLSIGHRYPQKMHISFSTGQVWNSELLSSISTSNILLNNTESVPFRLTPNIHHFMTRGGLEGIFTSSLLSIAKSLTDAEFELSSYLSVYMRDELISWYTLSRKPLPLDAQLNQHVLQNVDLIVKRMQGLSCKSEREASPSERKLEPVYQTLLDLISNAVNPYKLAQMDIVYLPQL